MPSTGVEERGQREWATRITGASTMQGEAPYSGQSSGSPAEAGRAKGEGLRQGSGFGIPAAERDAANDHVSDNPEDSPGFIVVYRRRALCIQILVCTR